MKKPWLKKILSYFVEIELESTESPFNPELYVLLTKGRYQLCTDNAIYSFDDKYDNFRSAFDQIDVRNSEIKSVLLLGLGLGSIPYMLEKVYQMDLHYTAVEIDPVICQLADKYVLHDLSSSFDIYPTDASQFLSWNQQKYDLIAMDIFQSATIPSQFESLDFLQTLIAQLNEGGVILYNRLHDDLDNQISNKLFKETWRNAFPEGTTIQTRNNQIFINDKNQLQD